MSTRSVMPTIPLTAATALTSIVAFLAWGTFFERAGDLLLPLAGGVVLVSSLGLVARLLRLPAVLVVGVQLLGVFLAANLAWGSSPLPTTTSLTEVARHLDASVDALTRWASPVPAEVDVAVAAPLLGALALHLLIDLCAVTLRRVPVAGLPLLAVMTVPTSVHGVDVHWLFFVATAACFLLLLCLQEGMRIGTWGRSFGPRRDRDPFQAFDGVDPGRHPIAIGALAVAGALVVAVVVPTFHFTPFQGKGGGGGDGPNEVRITNPIADLHRDLDRGEDVPLLQVSTEGVRPTYLRITALTQYSGNTWSPGDRDLPAVNAATGPVPQPPGLDPSVSAGRRNLQLRALSAFESTWLPTPLRVTEARAGETWRYDRTIMDFHSAQDDVTTANLEYDLVEVRPEIERQELIDAPPAPSRIRDRYTAVPDELPAIVGELAEQVTDGRETAYAKAVALQEWFRDPANFAYSLETEEGAVTRNDSAALEEFLSEDGRVGYCEQFSASMALMARSLGIPARVSVGFLRPDHIGPDLYEFSSHDLHAWPELWFEGYGWVLFEPTPQDRATAVPDYTTRDNGGGEEPEGPTDTPTDTPTSNEPSQQPSQRPQEPEPTTAPHGGGGADRDWRWLWAVPVVLLLVVVPLLPGWVRRRRTHQRLATGDVEAAWSELRDVVRDLQHDWPEDRSPRRTGQVIAGWLGAVPAAAGELRPATGPLQNPEATRAVEDLVDRLERERYAPAPADQDPAELAALVRTVTDALTAGAPPRVRRRARWFPASVLSGSS